MTIKLSDLKSFYDIL